MTRTLNPDLEKFIDEEVKAGRFASQTEAVEAGIAKLMLESEADVLDEQDIADILAAREEINRGEFVNAKEVHANLRRRFRSNHS